MVTVPQYEQQLQQRRKTLEATKLGVSEFKPKFKRTQEELRKATPLIQARVKGVVAKREKAKEQVLGEIKKELTTQQRLEAEFVPVKKEYQEYQKALKEQQEWKEAYEVATGDPRRWFGASRRVRMKAANITKGFQKNVAELQKQLQKGEKLIVDEKKLKISGVESKELGMSFPSLKEYSRAIGVELAKPTALEKKLKMTLPEAERYLTPKEYEKKMSISPAIEKQDLLEMIQKMKPTRYTPPPTVVAMPTIGEKIRGKIRKVTGISIPGISAVKDVTGVYAPRDIPSAVAKPIAEFGEEFPEFVGKQVEDIARTVGVPEKEFEIDVGKIPVGKKETIIFEPPSPKEPIDILKLKPKPDQIFKEVKTPITLGPSTMGKVAETTWAFGPYVHPATAIPLIGAHGVMGYEAFKKPIPTVDELMIEQTPDLSVKERQEWLEETPEGKTFKKDIEVYHKSLKTRKWAGLGTVAIAGAAIAVPFAYRGIKAGARYVKEPIPIYKAPRPKPISYYEAVVLPTEAEKAVGIAAVGEVFPGRIGAIQPRWEKWLGKPTKLQFIEKPTAKVGVMPFGIVGEGEAGLLAMQKVGPRTTMRTYDIITGKTIPAPKAIGEMPPLMQWITKKGLPPRALPEGVKLTAEAGRIFRFGRVSKDQARFFIPKTPVSLKDAPMQLGVTRAVRRKAPSPIQFYDVESAIKTTKSLMPRRAGKIDYVAGKVMVLPPIPSPTAVGEVIVGKLTKKQLLFKQKQLAEQVGGLVARAKVPKPKIPKFKIPKPKPLGVVTEPYVSYPTIVGGLGKVVSRYYGKGLYEVTPSEVVRLPAVAPEKLALTKPVTVETPLVYTKPEERVGFVQLGLPREKLKEELITVEVAKEKERLALIPKLAPVVRPREAVIPKVVPREVVIPKIVTEVIQKPKPKPFFPRPRPQPKPPKPKIVKRIPPPPIKLPDYIPPKKVKKKKLEEELLFPFVRRYGKFIPVTTKPLPKKKAIKKGLARVRETLAAALQLRRPTGEVVPFAKVTKEFRLGKELTIVQRAPRRLTRREEVQEIIASRKAGAVKFI